MHLPLRPGMVIRLPHDGVCRYSMQLTFLEIEGRVSDSKSSHLRFLGQGSTARTVLGGGKKPGGIGMNYEQSICSD